MLGTFISVVKSKEHARGMVHQDVIFSFNHPRPGRVSEVACILPILQTLVLRWRLEVSEDAGIKDLFLVECFALRHALPIQLRGFPDGIENKRCFAHDEKILLDSWL